MRCFLRQEKQMRLLPALILVAASASAEFSAQEKAEVLQQLDSLRLAESSISWALGHASVAPSDVQKVGDFVDVVALSWENHTKGVLWLLDQNGWDGGGETLIGTTSRADVLALGIQRIQNLADYNFAITLLDGMTVASSSRTTARQVLVEATQKRGAFNASLSYLEPRLAVNMALPGATRERSATAGPHGSYRMVGNIVNQWTRNHRSSWNALVAAMRANPGALPGSSNGLVFFSGHLIIGGSRNGSSLGLPAGVEAPEYAPHVETMFAGGTTARGREFFQILAMIEGLVNWTHVGPDSIDVNGRQMLRGYTYDLTILCTRGVYRLRDPALYVDAASRDFAFGMIDLVNYACAEWGNIDDLVYQGGMGLKFFQVFPPPGPGGGGCPSGQTCQPPDPPPITCGTGTHLEGTTCVADTPSPCASTPVLDLLSDRILARCVVPP